MRALMTALLVVGFVGCQTTGKKDVTLQSPSDKVSYSIGMTFGKNLNRDSITISPDALLRGVLDASADSAHRLMTDKEVQETLSGFQDSLQRVKMERAHAAGEKNMREGAAFLADNAKKPGVVTLPSGLQYRVLVEGKGPKPTAASSVSTHYRGKLLDGTEFDSSYKRGQPAVFPVNGVNRGWTEALQLMKVGSKWEIFIPPSLGYGESGAGSVIPPNATLIFEIELLSIHAE